MTAQELAPQDRVIAVGTSAGGVEALVKLVGSLPKDLPAAILVVLHLPAEGTSVLPRILMRAGALPAVHATDRAPLCRGTIYCAPPDRHLLVEPGFARVRRGPRENGHRPAADPLLRSAAEAYGRRAIGVILTGGGDDGAAGLVAIKRAGGLAVVQDPEDALTRGMPASALRAVTADHCLPVAQLGELLARLAREPLPPGAEQDQETAMAPTSPAPGTESATPGQLTGFTCPECGGRLHEEDRGDLLRYECRVGHAFSPESLLNGKTHALESALWAALNVLEENSDLARGLAARARERDHHLTAARFDARALDADQHAYALREILNGHRGSADLDLGAAGDGDEAVTAESIPAI